MKKSLMSFTAILFIIGFLETGCGNEKNFVSKEKLAAGFLDLDACLKVCDAKADRYNAEYREAVNACIVAAQQALAECSSQVCRDRIFRSLADCIGAATTKRDLGLREVTECRAVCINRVSIIVK